MPKKERGGTSAVIPSFGTPHKGTEKSRKRKKRKGARWQSRKERESIFQRVSTRPGGRRTKKRALITLQRKKGRSSAFEERGKKVKIPAETR